MRPPVIAARVSAVLLVAVAAWFIVLRPIAPPPPSATAPSITAPSLTAPATTAPSTTAPSATVPSARVPVTGSEPPGHAAPSTSQGTDPATCRPGIPARLVIPSLGVDAAFEQIGLDSTAAPDASGKRPLGNPQDRTKAGWYADGPRPGDGRGTVLTDGHTYRNNSAIFREDFAERIGTGQQIHIVQRNGSTCSYRISRVWREVDAANDYSRIVSTEKLYDFTGPERLFLVTCGGSWNSLAQDYDDVSMLIAEPVDR